MLSSVQQRSSFYTTNNCFLPSTLYNLIILLHYITLHKSHPIPSHLDIMLAFTLSTYTIFIIVMFVTVQGDLWTRGDPKWFDNTTQFGINSYKIDDPNA